MNSGEVEFHNSIMFLGFVGYIATLTLNDPDRREEYYQRAKDAVHEMHAHFCGLDQELCHKLISEAQDKAQDAAVAKNALFRV